MAFKKTFLYFTLFSLVQGLPTPHHRSEAGRSLPKFNVSTIVSGHRRLLGMTYPNYMMQLYQALIHGNNEDLSTLQNNVLQESDAVISLIAEECTQSNNHWILSFDMSSISSGIELRLAELRIHIPSFVESHNVTVDIYHTKDSKDMLYLGSFKTELSHLGSSWKVFNISNILQYFLQYGKRYSSRDYIEAKDMPERDQEYSSAGEVTDSEDSFQEDAGHAPVFLVAERVLLVVFAKDRFSPNLHVSSSLLKTVESSKYVMIENTTRVAGKGRHKRTRKEKHHLMMRNIPTKPLENGEHLCRKVEMFVDFEQIGWGNWIVYPKKYNAYRCEGVCPVPLNATFKPTNHSYMKSVLKLYHPERVECPSCIPVKMSPLSMLYYEAEILVLKHFTEMIVEDCGCN